MSHKRNIADKILAKRYADGGDVVATPPTDEAYAQALIANQQQAEAKKLPTERQPFIPEQQPQEAGLEHPEISPEELLGGAIAAPLARKAVGAAEAAFAKAPGNFMELEHYSNVPNIKAIDPSKAGSGYDSGARGRALETPISFHYVKGAAPETETGLHNAAYKYTSKIDLDKHPIYDLSTDPHGIAAKAIEANNGVVNMSEIAKATKDAGFSGFKVSQHPHEPSRNAVMMFHPTEVASAQANYPSKIARVKDFMLDEAGSVPLSKDKGSDNIRKVAQRYMDERGMPQSIAPLTKADPERGARIANEFHNMAHDPDHPEVKKAYDALIKETADQYKAIKNTGLKIEKMKPGMDNPYPNGSKQMAEDIHKNNHLWYYPTDQGFGSGGDFSNHPLFTETAEKLNGETLKANDMFRIVHDYFGHAKEGNQFGPSGEEMAWQIHAPMYSPTARKAMTTETRGQNSWVNFGPHGEANRSNPAKTVFADQKAGLLPDWVVNEGSSVPPAAKSQWDIAKETQRKGINLYKDEVAKSHQKRRQGYAEGGEVLESPAPITMTPTAFPTPAIEAPQVDGSTPTVNVLTPYGELVGLGQEELDSALSSGYKLATPEQVHEHKNQEKYGTPGQQFKAGLEGLAEGVAGPLAPMAERALGVDPAAIRGRQEANPITHGVGEAAGLVGGTVAGFGIGAGIEGAGMAARAALPAGRATFISQVGPEAVKGAFEMGLLQGSTELAKLAKEDPNQTAETAMTDIGLATVMGGVFGGAVGAMFQKAKYSGMDLPEVAEPAFVSQLDRQALEAGHLETSIRHADHLPDHDKQGMLAGLLDRTEKAEAPQIRAAAKRLGIEPLEGMVSSNKWVQKAEDGLINGAPTYSGVRRQRLYNEAYGRATSAADQVLGEESRYTKAELGDIFKKSISAQLEEQNAPIKALYDDLRELKEVLPLRNESRKEIAAALKGMKELRVSPSSPEGKLATRIIRESANYKTVDDIQLAKSILNRSISPTASTGEKRMAAVISDTLTSIEERAIERHATEAMVEFPELAEKLSSLIGQRKAAASQYKDFIKKVQTLSEQLGKGRVYGVQDALNFINERLTPEEIVQRLGSLKDSNFRKFFAKEYPEQHELMREFQKSELRDKASATGQLSPKVLFNHVNKLEPEIQGHIFSKAELQQLKDSETIIRSFPPNFNPSGTSHQMAMRDFFIHPKGAAMSNLRDFAMERFVKGVAGSPEVEKAATLAKATVTGEKLATKAVAAIFKGTAMPFTAASVIAGREKLAKLVDMYAANPDKLFQSGENNPIPAYAQAFAGTSARAVQYLSSVKPNTDKAAPLDRQRQATSFEKAKYNNALDLAQQPLLILDKIQKGMLTAEDLTTVQTIYPNLYKALQQKVMASVVEATQKAKSIPYAQRLQLSAFLGTPLDSSLTPQGILGLQMAQNKGGQEQQPQPETLKPSQSGMAKLSGVAKSAMTQSQTRAAARAAR